MPKRVPPFPNPEPSRSDPFEATIALTLWRWAFSSPEERSEIAAVGSELAVAIEFYLCGTFHLIEFTRSRGIWCDGIIELSITRNDRCAFVIAGVAYAPQKLTPFEIEFHFARRRDAAPMHTFLHFGEADFDGEIRWHTYAKNAAKIMANRPRTNADWAVAVELTSAAT